MSALRAAPVRMNPLPWGITWAVCFLVARFTLEVETLPTAARLLVALTPVPLGVVILRVALRAARGLDELEQRIQLEALATAFLLAVMLLMTLGLVERVVALDFENWSYLHVWGILPLLYALGLVRARRRYHEEPPQS